MSCFLFVRLGSGIKETATRRLFASRSFSKQVNTFSVFCITAKGVLRILCRFGDAMSKGDVVMKSVWQNTDKQIHYPALKGNIRTQVLVIGGGMAGVLCARKLQEAGKDVILAEANRIGDGITAKTTAVLTAQHDFLYQDMVERFGEATAGAYLHANLDAVRTFRELSQEIPCDFENKPSVQFTAGDATRLQLEVQIVQRLGFNARMTDAPWFLDAKAAVEYPDMAQFHPVKFVTGASRILRVFENSPVRNLEGTTAVFDRGTVEAQQVVVATHFPFINRRGLYFMKLYQNRSYVLALENAPDPGATIAELEGQGIYLRQYGELLLLGGGDHRTGKKGGGFHFLRDYAQTHFPKAREKFCWANQDCMSLDGLPYVGAYSPNMPGVYVATGFNAWGMTNSMAAAQLITDMICGKENLLTKALDPNRSILHKQMLCNIGETVANFAIPTVRRCPHLGCALRWNPQEHSWDCPCHGSRFTEDGKLLDTPAQRDKKP